MASAKRIDFLEEKHRALRQHAGSIVVVKYGGAAMTDEHSRQAFARDAKVLKQAGIQLVIVHGGGKSITEVADKLGAQTRFIDGLRYTDESMMDVVQMVLAGKMNQDIVAELNLQNSHAVGVSGIDANLLNVKTYSDGGERLGLVGEIIGVNVSYLRLLLKNDLLPVIAPIGVSDTGQVHNINADVAAAVIAEMLCADGLIFLSDVEGVMANGTLIDRMDEHDAEKLIDNGIITEGMIPKIRSAFSALAAGVKRVRLIDSRVPDSLLLSMSTERRSGTELTLSNTKRRQEVAS